MKTSKTIKIISLMILIFNFLPVVEAYSNMSPHTRKIMERQRAHLERRAALRDGVIHLEGSAPEEAPPPRVTDISLVGEQTLGRTLMSSGEGIVCDESVHNNERVIQQRGRDASGRISPSRVRGAQ